jgi:predicted small lipoprotein YifL
MRAPLFTGLLLCTLLGACGQTGPLYLPGDAPESRAVIPGPVEAADPAAPGSAE